MARASRHDEGTQIIAWRPEDAFDFLADARNEWRWNTWAGRIERVSGGVLGRGTRFRGRYQNLGDVEIELVEYARPRYLRQARRGSFGEFRCTYTLEAEPGGTRLRWSGECTPAPAAMFLAPLLRAVLRWHLRALVRALVSCPQPGVVAPARLPARVISLDWSEADHARHTGT